MASAKTTTNHDEIRKWAEERNAKPSTVKRTSNPEDPGILRLNFPGYSGEDSLQEIPWDEWFKKFDEQELALLYQEETKDGQKSNFNKLVSRRGRSTRSSSPRTASSTRNRSTSTRRTTAQK
jgi:hypothetical protein